MTKAWEHGENEFTRLAKREGLRRKVPATVVLAEMEAAARATGEKRKLRRIIQAQKFLAGRNRRKRRKKP